MARLTPAKTKHRRKKHNSKNLDMPTQYMEQANKLSCRLLLSQRVRLLSFDF